MFCTACGQQLIPGAAVCPRCGRPAGVAPVPILYNRVHRHLQPLWILWLVYAAWTLLGYFIALPFLLGASHGWFIHSYWHGGGYWHSHSVWWPMMGAHMPWLLPLVTFFVLIRFILDLVTAIALMQRKPWARVLAIVVAILTLIKPLAGTLLAIYTLWVLAPGLSGREWNAMSRQTLPGGFGGYQPLQ